MSVRLTDKLSLYKYLFEQTASRRDFLTQLLISEHYFIQGVPEHFTAFINGLSLGYHLWPLNELPHIS